MSRLWSSDPATNTLSPHTMGELVPTLGIATFQAMFSFFAPSHAVGALTWPATPLPYGPRNTGQAWSGGGSILAAGDLSGSGVLTSSFLGSSFFGSSFFAAGASVFAGSAGGGSAGFAI